MLIFNEHPLIYQIQINVPIGLLTFFFSKIDMYHPEKRNFLHNTFYAIGLKFEFFSLVDSSILAEAAGIRPHGLDGRHNFTPLQRIRLAWR